MAPKGTSGTSSNRPGFSPFHWQDRRQEEVGFSTHSAQSPELYERDNSREIPSVVRNRKNRKKLRINIMFEISLGLGLSVLSFCPK